MGGLEGRGDKPECRSQLSEYGLWKHNFSNSQATKNPHYCCKFVVMQSYSNLLSACDTVVARFEPIVSTRMLHFSCNDCY